MKSTKRCLPEQILSKLREAEVLIAQGQSVSQAAKALSIADQTYYRWRKEYGGMRTDQARRLTDLFVRRGTRAYLRSDNGAEFTAKAVREWLQRVGVRTLYIEPGSPWENGYIESFNGKLRDEFLDGEIFDTLLEAKGLTERWRVHYNRRRPHSALGYRPPTPEAVEPLPPGSSTLRPSPRARAAAGLT